MRMRRIEGREWKSENWSGEEERYLDEERGKGKIRKKNKVKQGGEAGNAEGSRVTNQLVICK